MKTIWKFRLEMAFMAARVRHPIKMPKGAEILHVANDFDGSLCLWAVVDDDAETEVREFYSFFTGVELPKSPMNHIGTVMALGIVVHVFEPIEVGAVF